MRRPRDGASRCRRPACACVSVSDPRIPLRPRAQHRRPRRRRGAAAARRARRRPRAARSRRACRSRAGSAAAPPRPWPAPSPRTRCSARLLDARPAAALRRSRPRRWWPAATPTTWRRRSSAAPWSCSAIEPLRYVRVDASTPSLRLRVRDARPTASRPRRRAPVLPASVAAGRRGGPGRGAGRPRPGPRARRRGADPRRRWSTASPSRAGSRSTRATREAREAALAAGAFGVAVSGAGPTLLAIVAGGTRTPVGRAVVAAYAARRASRPRPARRRAWIDRGARRRVSAAPRAAPPAGGASAPRSPARECPCGGLLDVVQRPRETGAALRAPLRPRAGATATRPCRAAASGASASCCCPAAAPIVTHPEGNTPLYRRDGDRALRRASTTSRSSTRARTRPAPSRTAA